MTVKKPKPDKIKRTGNIGGHTYSPKLVAKCGGMVRAGTKNLKEISAETGVPVPTLRGWLKKYEWRADLADRVREEAHRRMVMGGLINEEKAIDDAASELVVVLSRHKKALNKNMDIIEKLQSQLDPVTPEDAAALSELPSSDEDSDKQGIGQRAMTAKIIADTLDKTITGMRKTYRMDADTKEVSTYEELLAQAKALDV